MISFLRGEPILEKEFVTMLVGGVGYGVRVSTQTRAVLQNQTTAELYVYTHVREDALELYGFPSRQERDIFLLLTGVSGVGPKTALGILNIDVRSIVEAVQNADVTLFSGVPRVGKKLAQKIIIELRSKLGALKELDLGPSSVQHQELMTALVSLGFHEHAIEQVLQTLPIEELELEVALRQAIQQLGKARTKPEK